MLSQPCCSCSLSIDLLQWRFVENPPLNNALTAVFLCQIVCAIVLLYNEEAHPDQVLHPLALLGVSVAVCSLFVFLVNVASAAFSEFLKHHLVRLKLVTAMPVHSKELLKKWQDRSWQFIVHTVLSVAEVCAEFPYIFYA